MKKSDLGNRNFSRALKKLEEFLAEPAKTEREQAGIIQAFEFCFELGWKSLQKKAQSEGLAIGSPRRALEYALQSGAISTKDEPQWVQMLEDRNLTVHAYDEEVAKAILRRIPGYAKLFQSLQKKA
jgi:nucleotidyltransferase substrate binding protein (TIGR01987 family)